MIDILIKGGQVVDGTGQAGFLGDVAITDGRISAISVPGREPQAKTVIDVNGLVVAPGFIDIHSHSDLVFTLEPSKQRKLLEGRIRQGITTEIVGNCGLGCYPATEASAPLAQAQFGFLRPSDASVMGHSIDDYLSHLETSGVAVNVATLVPHGPIRLATPGLDTGPSDSEQLSAAIQLIEQSLNAGAFGLSFGLIYPPGLTTSTEEIRHLCTTVAKHQGIVTFHQRSGSPELLDPAIREILDVGRATQAHVHLSHEHAQGRLASAGVEKLLQYNRQAAAEGIDYTQDVIPYTTVHTTLLALYPPWSLTQGIPGWLELARCSEQRQKMQQEIESVVPTWPPWLSGNWPTNIVRDVGYGAIRIAECETRPETIGQSLEELGHSQGEHPFAAMTDLLIGAEGQVTMCLDGISGTVDDEAPLERLIADPNRALISDAWEIGRGRPHPGAYGAFPKVFRRYVRERKILDLPSAVRKLTSLPAAIMDLKNRGTLKEGAWADVVVFDPDRICDTSTEQHPRSVAQGIEWVFVNGTCLYGEGRLLDECPGQVIRRG